MRTAPAAWIVIASLAVAACGAGGTDDASDGFGDELPPVEISSVASSTTAPAPTTTEPEPGAGTGEGAVPTTTEETIEEAAEGGGFVIDGAATLSDDGAVGRVEVPADATDAADRLDDPALLAWVGGSDVVWDDRSLPAAVSQRLDRVGHRPVEVRAVTDIGPDVDGMISLVDRAVADGADGLLVAMNVSWVGWGGTTQCNGITPVYAFYACILEPLEGSERADRAEKLQRLVDAVAATELPAFIYVIAHSAQAMSDPLLADRITAAEAFVASFDPGLDRIQYGDQIVTRGVSGADEGTAFLDMVHPTPAGVDLIANVMTPEIEQFFTTQLG